MIVSAYEALAGRLGEDAWKAVNFYFDMSLVARNPEKFSKLLDSLFGRASMDLQTSIVKTLLSRIGAPIPPIVEGTRLDNWYSGNQNLDVGMFQDWIKRARDKFVTSEHHTRGDT